VLSVVWTIEQAHNPKVVRSACSTFKSTPEEIHLKRWATQPNHLTVLMFTVYVIESLQNEIIKRTEQCKV